MSAEAKRLRDAANGFVGYAATHHGAGAVLIDAALHAAAHIERTEKERDNALAVAHMRSLVSYEQRIDLLEGEIGRLVSLIAGAHRPHGSCRTDACTRCDAEKGLRDLAASLISFDDPSEDPSMAASIRRMIEGPGSESR